MPAPGAATITLDRSQRRNAMTPGMWHGLAAIGRALPPEVRVVVVQGAGPSFSAGIDLRLFTPEGVPGEDPLVSPADPGFDEWIAGCQAGYRWLRDPGIVSVAAVRGHAIGAGFQLALSCDLRVLADDAQLCMKEPALGLVPDLTGTQTAGRHRRAAPGARAVPDQPHRRGGGSGRAAPGRTGGARGGTGRRGR